MALFEDGCYGSLKGIALIAKVLAGRCTMNYTRVAVGKGAIAEGESPKTLTEPPEYVMDARISGITNPVDGECQVTVQINSADVESGFYCTGILLYADDPDEGEVPFTYLVLENEPEWIRPASSIVGKLATFDIIAAVGDVDCVTAAIDPEAIATIAEVQQLISEHNADPDAHASVIGNTVEAKIAEMEERGDVVSEDEVLALIAEYGGGGIAKEIEFHLQPSAWHDSESGSYPIYADIADEEITDEMRPDAMLDEQSLDFAAIYQLCPAIRSYAGYVRLRAKEVPEHEISGVLYLLGKGGGGGGSYILPTATPTRLGGVKIGNGLNVEDDGTTFINSDEVADDVTPKVIDEAGASDEEVEKVIDEVFGDE